MNTHDEARDHGHQQAHVAGTERSPFAPAAADLIRVGSRRWFLQTGMAGLGGLTLPGLLQQHAVARRKRPARNR